MVVAGGSVAGLLCAREISKKGHSVLVVEEDHEIGTPEHCGGLVSMSALQEIGIIPTRKIYNHIIEEAKVFSPNGNHFTLDATKQKVAEIDRREFDKQIAFQAQKNGAEIRVKSSLQKITEEGIQTKDAKIKCKVIVDARGVASLISKNRDGILSSAQYEITANWIHKGKVKLYFDQQKYPGFFAWIIPTSECRGKVGVAGRAINSAYTLEGFLASMGKYSTLRKIFAPIWIKGPIKQFVSKNVVTVGDAAGQSKPTTAGGIYSCGMGGIIAGKTISSFLTSGQDLSEYQKSWHEKFGAEFEKQLLARKVLESLSNETVNAIFGRITPEITKEISQSDDFDFHTSAIVKMLGVKGTIKTAQAVLGDKIKNLLS